MRFPRFHRSRRHRRWDDSLSRHPGTLGPSRLADLGDEVEAFLVGRLVDHLMVRERSIPPWAALNRLAHATQAELADLLEADERQAGGATGWVRPWALTERALALRVLSGVSDAAALQELQLTVLVPLELALVERYKERALSVTQVFDAASEALDHHLLDH